MTVVIPLIFAGIYVVFMSDEILTCEDRKGRGGERGPFKSVAFLC